MKLASVLATVFAASKSVSYDSKSLLIDGQRELILAGHIHYPRSTPEQWPSLFQKSRDAGLNAIDTYVFWNEHEKERGVYDFQGRRDLRRFVREAGEHGLYVILRIGPYVCAETNLGGLPSWLISIDGMQTRTCNPKWQAEMETFLRYIVEYMKDLFYTRNGPIILLQVENEFGNVQPSYPDGQQYIDWAVSVAESITKEIPWFVCQQDNVAKVINGCNGFYCDEWIAKRPFKNQPAFWIENWTGWYQKWGESQPYRPAKDLAFATLRFLAKGGSYVGYYMWHGGTFFGRSAGAGVVSVSNPGFITSYDYDAPLDEYGLPSEPKYSLLKAMNQILQKYHDHLFDNTVRIDRLGDIEIHSYGELHFISNVNMVRDMDVTLAGKQFFLPKWSVSIIFNGNQLFNSASDLFPANHLEYRPIDGIHPSKLTYAQLPVGINNDSKSILHDKPLDQLSITLDKTDYMWYELELFTSEECYLRLERVEAYISVFFNNEFVGSSSGGKNLEFKLPSNNSAKNIVQILSQTIGLANYGGYFAEKKMGIVGKVFVNEQEVRSQWKHLSGFSNSTLEYNMFENAPLHIQEFDNTSPIVANNQPFILYRLEYHGIHVEDMILAVDLGTMGKGQLYFNGIHLGRYWNIKGVRAEDPPDLSNTEPQQSAFDGSCDYAGIYNPVNCRKRENKVCQRYYYLPKEYINDKSQNILEVFEEVGGNPAGIQIVSVSRI